MSAAYAEIRTAAPTADQSGEMPSAVSAAVRTLVTESAGLDLLRSAISGVLAGAFTEAVARIQKSRGRVIVTGVGKSGHVGQKIAATFASTGTPAFFVHPTEASHGDLGMITPDDVLVVLSWSGETVELKNILTYSRRFAVPLIAVTSRRDSALGQNADVVLELPRASEACPHGLAPTTSTTMQLALGDCLAIALLEAKGFTAHDFREFHPGGSLGASLKHVADVMHTGESLPIAGPDDRMDAALVIMTTKALGCLGIVDSDGRLAGIITDGDLRRHMGPELVSRTTREVMTRNPKTTSPDTLASAALEMMNASRITALFVLKDERPVGVVHVHDFLRAGIV
ncbi:MAG: SIS domain-containing protein [Hyphomicrobiaceae bacterium]